MLFLRPIQSLALERGFRTFRPQNGATMENMRAYRRAQSERIKQSRRHYWGRWDGELSAKHKGMVASTAAICSCWMCGNPRKYEKERTIQERRAMQKID